jgi:hypothetical protein
LAICTGSAEEIVRACLARLGGDDSMANLTTMCVRCTASGEQL